MLAIGNSHIGGTPIKTPVALRKPAAWGPAQADLSRNKATTLDAACAYLDPSALAESGAKPPAPALRLTQYVHYRYTAGRVSMYYLQRLLELIACDIV